MRTAFRNCPICDHGQVDVLHTQRFELLEGHPLAAGYDVVCCAQCGFVYADTTVTQADYDRFYAENSKYEDAKTSTGSIENPFDWERQQQTARQIVDFLNQSTAAILDVGCANGGLLKALQESGSLNLCGIDPSPICVKNTRQLGIEAHVGSLFKPFRRDSFDCVVLSHTLEHIHDLHSAAQWIHSSLKDNAFLYIEVPDAARYTDFVDAPFQEFNTEHINHFSLASLKNFMSIHGFEPMESGQKVILTSTNKPYPAIYCFARKSLKRGSFERDNLLRPKIESYSLRSQGILEEIKLHLQNALATEGRLVVWGTGQLTMKLLVDTALAAADIIAFVDSNPINQGKNLRGIRVISPAEVRQYPGPILISSILHEQSISQQIQQMRLNNHIIFLRDS